jgi:hypothetical protein
MSQRAVPLLGFMCRYLERKRIEPLFVIGKMGANQSFDLFCGWHAFLVQTEFPATQVRQQQKFGA